MPPLKWRNHLLNWLLVRSDWQKSPPPLPIFILDDHFLGDDDEPFNKVPQGGLWPITWNTLATWGNYWLSYGPPLRQRGAPIAAPHVPKFSTPCIQQRNSQPKAPSSSLAPHRGHFKKSDHTSDIARNMSSEAYTATLAQGTRIPWGHCKSFQYLTRTASLGSGIPDYGLQARRKQRAIKSIRKWRHLLES